MKNEYISQYNVFFEKLIKQREELKGKLCRCDLEQEDILHFIEFEKYDAITMVKLVKKLKNVRQRRREIKDQYQVAQMMCDRLKNQSKNEDRSYNYRTDITKEFKI